MAKTMAPKGKRSEKIAEFNEANNTGTLRVNTIP